MSTHAKRSIGDISGSATAKAEVKKARPDEDNETGADSGESAADVSAQLMSSLSASEISNLMGQEGPVVKVVLLQPDGTATEMEADMSPKKATPQDLLGGAASFLGQFPQLDLIVMMRREEQASSLAENQHKLP